MTSSPVHQMTIDDPEGSKSSKSLTTKIPLKTKLRNSLLPILIGLSVFLVVVVLIVVSVVLTRKDAKEANKDYIGNRVDCVPWLKMKSDRDIKAACRDLDSCIYEAVSTEDNAPKCFYNMDKFQLRVISQEETKYGASYVVENALDTSKKIKIDFESLDDQTIRFKVTVLELMMK